MKENYHSNLALTNLHNPELLIEEFNLKVFGMEIQSDFLKRSIR